MDGEGAQILQYTKDIVFGYFTRMDIQPLLDFFADDVLWLGAGKQMSRQGYDAVTQAFIDGQKQIVPCTLDNAEYVLRRLSPDLWLSQMSSDMESIPSVPLFIHEYQRCTFIFRRNDQARSGVGWEVVYLHNSLAYRFVKSGELFAFEHSVRNFDRRHRKSGERELSSQEQEKLFHFIERTAYEPLGPDTRELLQILSLFSAFTFEQAVYMVPRLNTRDILQNELDRNAFLYPDYPTESYYFHPVYRQYLRQQFARQPQDWQFRQRQLAGRWFIHCGKYDNSLSLAWQTGDMDTALAAVEKGSIDVLFSQPAITAQTILRKALPEQRAAHLTGCILCLADVFFKDGLEAFQELFPPVLQLVQDAPLPEQRKEEYLAGLMLLKGFCAYEDLDKMDAGFAESRRIMAAEKRQRREFLPWSFGSPSLLGLYARRCGNFHSDCSRLDRFLWKYRDFMTMEETTAWRQLLCGEQAYLTGHPEQALQCMQAIVSPPGNGTIDAQMAALFLAVRIALCQNQPEQIRQYMQRISSFAPNSHHRFYVSMSTLCEASIAGLLHHRSLADMRRILEQTMVYAPCRPVAHGIHQCLYLANGEYEQVIARSPYMGARNEMPFLASLYETILLAGAYEQLGNVSRSETLLRQALIRGQTEHLVMPFAEFAEYIPCSLTRLRAREIELTSFIDEINRLSLAPSLSSLRRQFQSTDEPSLANLTKRETEITALVAQGLTNKDIAQRLNVAEVTVKKALTHIYKKLDIPNRAALTRYVLKK